MKKPSETAAILGFVTLLSVLVYWPIFTSLRLPGGEMSDTIHQGYPFFSFIEASLRQGQLPHWNPYIYCGVPFYASFSAPVFYPLRGLPMILFGSEAAIRFLFPAHLFLAGFFTWLFMGSIGVSRGGRLVGATAYALGAWANTLFYAGHGSKVISWAFLPLLLYGVNRFNQTRRAKWLGVGGLAVGMQGLSSHPQMLLYSGVAASVFALWHLGSIRQWWWKISGLGAIMALGVAVSAVQLYPGYLFSRHSTRGDGLDPATAASYSMPPEETFAMILPSAFGLRHCFPDSSISGVPVYFGRLGLRLSSEFTGVAVFLLALAGFASGKDKKVRGALLSLAVLGAVVSWGGYTPLFRILYDVIPVFRKIRAPHMAAFITATSVALASGPGFDVLFRGKPSKRMVLTFGAPVALFLLMLISAEPLGRALQSSWWTRMGVPGGAGFEFMVRHRVSLLEKDLFRALLSSSGVLLALFLAWKHNLRAIHAALAVTAITALELIPFNRSFQVYLHHTSLDSMFPPDRNLVETAGPGRVFPGGNELVPLGVRSVTGYHAAKPAITDRMAPLLGSATPEVLYSFGISAFRLPEGTFSWRDIHPALSEGTPDLPINPMPRAFIPAQPVSGTGEQGFQALARGLNPMTVSIIDSPLETVPPACSGTAEITLDNPTEVVVRTGSATASVLVLADSWYPSWRADVNGLPADIHLANGWMRAVILPPGDNTVRFHYDTSDVTLGLRVSIAAVLLALALLLIPGKKRRIP